MTPRRRFTNGIPPTLEQWRQWDANGELPRPYTDDDFAENATRRHHDAVASDAVTAVLGVMPTGRDSHGNPATACGDAQGSSAGYQRHWLAGEVACADCKAAKAAAKARRQQGRVA